MYNAMIIMLENNINNTAAIINNVNCHIVKRSEEMREAKRGRKYV
jgi:hypothetical protein